MGYRRVPTCIDCQVQVDDSELALFQRDWWWKELKTLGMEIGRNMESAR